MLSGNHVTTKYKTLRLKGLSPLGLSTLRINYTSFLLEMPLTKSFCQRERKKRTEKYFKKILRFLETFFFSEVSTNLANRKKMKLFVGGKMPLFEKYFLCV